MLEAEKGTPHPPPPTLPGAKATTEPSAPTSEKPRESPKSNALPALPALLRFHFCLKIFLLGNRDIILRFSRHLLTFHRENLHHPLILPNSHPLSNRPRSVPPASPSPATPKKPPSSLEATLALVLPLLQQVRRRRPQIRFQERGATRQHHRVQTQSPSPISMIALSALGSLCLPL